MSKRKLCASCNYKTVRILIGVIYIILTGLNLTWSVYTIKDHFSRLLLINIGFQILLAITSFFYLINIYLTIKELFLPFIIALIYSVILSFVWIVIMFSLELMSGDCKIALFDVDIKTKLRLLPFLCFCIFAHTFSAYFLIKFYINLDKETRANKRSNRSYYAYRRFGINLPFFATIPS